MPPRTSRNSQEPFDGSFASLLGRAGLDAPAPPRPPTPEEALRAWARSGGMALTGPAEGPPIVTASGMLAAAEEAAQVVSALAPDGVAISADVALFARAGIERRVGNGRTSVSGSCRLLRALDGWLAINLARPVDHDSVPAIVGLGADPDPWLALASAAAQGRVREIVERAQLLGVPAAALGDRASPAHAVRVSRGSSARSSGSVAGALVVDLSAMWAGPLCSRILRQAGARTIKVESSSRPDGARQGSPAFFQWLNAGAEQLEIDFRARSGLRQLRRLLAEADLVIEGSRPRALRQLGIDAEELVAGGRSWVSITGYGREGPGANKVAFGDDAAVAGGLVAWDADSNPVFFADAAADPLSGLYAAGAALAVLNSEFDALVSVSMRDVAAHIKHRSALLLPELPETSMSVDSNGETVLHGCGWHEPVRSPRPPADSALTARPQAPPRRNAKRPGESM